MMVDQQLIASIAVRGVAIAIKVKQIAEDEYLCIDGHKRLNALEILAKKDIKFSKVPCVIKNDFSKAGSGYWGNTKNKH